MFCLIRRGATCIWRAIPQSTKYLYGIVNYATIRSGSIRSSTTRRQNRPIVELILTTPDNKKVGNYMLYLISHRKSLSTTEFDRVIERCWNGKLSAQALSLYTTLENEGTLPKLSMRTATNLVRMCALEHNQECMDSIYGNCSESIRSSYSFQAEFARACLLCGDIVAGIQMVKIFVEHGLPFSDCDNILLEGLSEANCHEECLQLFFRIRKEQKRGKNILLYSHGYSSVVRSACELMRYGLAVSVMEEMRRLSIQPLPFAYFELCDLYEHKSTWRRKADSIVEKLNEKGVSLTEDEMTILTARLKEMQYEKAVTLMNEYCRLYDVHEVISAETNTVKMDISYLPESASRMICLGLLKRLGNQPIPLDKATIFLNVGKNNKVVKQLLEVDLVPPIPMILSKQTIQIDGSGLLPWINRMPITIS